MGSIPIVQIQWTEGRSEEQKRQVAQEITDSIARISDIGKERVFILFHDLPKKNVANAGKLMSEK